MATAGRFEPGSPNMLGQVALLASLQVLNSAGAPQVETRVLENSLRLIEGVKSIPGLRITSNTRPERLSGIVALSHRSRTPGALLASLERAGVSAARRGESVRLSPHFYQGRQQMDALLEALEAASQQ